MNMHGDPGTSMVRRRRRMLGEQPADMDVRAPGVPGQDKASIQPYPRRTVVSGLLRRKPVRDPEMDLPPEGARLQFPVPDRSY